VVEFPDTVSSLSCPTAQSCAGYIGRSQQLTCEIDPNSFCVSGRKPLFSGVDKMVRFAEKVFQRAETEQTTNLGVRSSNLFGCAISFLKNKH